MAKAMKTASTITLHVAVASGVGYAMTGSWSVGGAMALIEPVCNVIVQGIHERAWSRARR